MNDAHIENHAENHTPKVLARSSDCQLLLTESWSKNSKTIGLFLAGVFIAAAYFAYCTYENNPLLTIIVLVIAGAAYFWLNGILTKGRADYARYLDYCNKEHMVVDEEKIYGCTAIEDFLLCYDQIRNVKTYSNMREGEVRALEKVILQITDVHGKIYVFYSFKNTSELYSVICRKIPKKNT